MKYGLAQLIGSGFKKGCFSLLLEYSYCLIEWGTTVQAAGLSYSPFHQGVSFFEGELLDGGVYVYV
jgi:hypothetical protein